jgi:hypothetical protein
MANTQSVTARSPWPAWAIGLPAGLGIAETGLLGLYAITSIINVALDDNLPAAYAGTSWLEAGFIGQVTLAIAAIVLLVLGVRRPGQRRTAAIAAWVIIPLGCGVALLSTTLGAPGQ